MGIAQSMGTLALESIIATDSPVANIFENNSVEMKGFESYLKESFDGWAYWKWTWPI
jgi:hypothetical protein